MIGLSIDMTKVDKEKLKNGKYLNLTVSVNDETGSYGHNVSGWVEQSKEDREAGLKRDYCANGKVFWTDGKIEKAVHKIDGIETAKENDLPF